MIAGEGLDVAGGRGPDPWVVRTVLHTARLVGFAETDRLVDRSGLDAGVVDRCLVFATAQGWVQRREGGMPGWMLTAEGRARGERMLRDELREIGDAADIDAGSLVAGAYRRFLELNPALLEICTAWQLRPTGDETELNDHSDSRYDAAVIARLACLHGDITPVLAEVSSGVDRFAAYGARFERALRRVTAGDHDWFTRPVVDSYHTVWFELHEDLLATLGLRRAGERAGERAGDVHPGEG